MKIRRHHSDTTRNLHAALKALTEADVLIRAARDLLTEAGGGRIIEDTDPATFEAMFALNRGRDCDGEPDPNGDSVLKLLANHLEVCRLLAISRSQDLETILAEVSELSGWSVQEIRDRHADELEKFNTAVDARYQELVESGLIPFLEKYSFLEKLS